MKEESKGKGSSAHCCFFLSPTPFALILWPNVSAVRYLYWPFTSPTVCDHIFRHFFWFEFFSGLNFFLVWSFFWFEFFRIFGWLSLIADDSSLWDCVERRLERLDSQLFPQFSRDLFLDSRCWCSLLLLLLGLWSKQEWIPDRVFFVPAWLLLPYSFLTHFPPTFSSTNDRRSSVIPRFFSLSDPVG